MRKCCSSIWPKQQTIESGEGGRNPAFLFFTRFGVDRLVKAVAKVKTVPLGE